MTPRAEGDLPIRPSVWRCPMLLQVGFDVADHEVPTLTAVDRRWQMILDCMGKSEPVMSQGAVFNFRERARANGLMALLLNKTVELARTSNGCALASVFRIPTEAFEAIWVHRPF